VKIFNEDYLAIWTSCHNVNNFEKKFQPINHLLQKQTKKMKIHESIHHMNIQILEKYKFNKSTLSIQISIVSLALAEKIELVQRILKILPEDSIKNSQKSLVEFTDQTRDSLDHSIEIKIPPDQAISIVSKLSDFPEIIWIERRDSYKIFNKWAKGVIESGYAGTKLLRFYIF